LSGRLDEAESELRNSLAINERLGREEGIAADPRDLGYVYQRRGDLSQASTYWVRARDRFLLVNPDPKAVAAP
jgi:hypothetical protein